MAADGADYVVVGAGSAGCVIASRLSEDPALRVTLLEAGGPDRHPLMTMPLAFLRLIRDPKVNWNYVSEPEPYADNRRILLPRGKLLGGTSSINGMAYSRGHPLDYDQWAQMGLKGWSHADVLPYFRRSETSWRGASEHHGADGPLTVSRMKPDRTLFPATMATAAALGYPVLDDAHGAAAEGFSPVELTVHRGRRGGTSTRYLRPALSRPNLSVEIRALTIRILIERGRAVGVEYVQDGKRKQVFAEREVILCGGSYNSPQLLMLSGVGPADALKAVGVAPVHDLPGVGQNLQEHPLASLGFAASRPVGFESQLRLDRLTVSVLRWALTGTGPAAQLPVTCFGFIKTREGLQRPDVKANIYPTGIDAEIWFPLLRKGKGHVLSAMAVLLRPESRGEVTLRSANPADKPVIRLNLLKAPGDRATLRRAVRQLRAFYATPPLADLVARELWPGTEIQTDAEIDAYVRRTVVTAHHPAGACAMGLGPDAVCDAELRVRGVEGLRVVDASVMPVVIGGNTNAPVIMIAEKASDMILGRAPLLAGPPRPGGGAAATSPAAA